MKPTDLATPTPPWITILVTRAERDVEAFAEAIAAQTPAKAVVRILLGERMQYFDTLFDEFATQLAFPSYFGRNFNALKDCLTDLAWLPADGYVLIIRDATLVLAHEGNDDWSALLALLQNVADWWARSIVEEEAWDRAAVPFHIVLQTTAAELSMLRTRLEHAGLTSSQLSVS